MASGAGYNPYRDDAGKFTSPENVGKKVSDDYQQAVASGDAASQQAIENYVTEKMPESELGKSLLEKQYGVTPSASKKKTLAPQHPWVGDLAAANNVNKNPSKGDQVVFNDPYSYDKPKLISGRVSKIGKRQGKPYVVVDSGAYDPLTTVWPEGEPNRPAKTTPIAVRSTAALGGTGSWDSRFPKEEKDIKELLETFDQVDMNLLKQKIGQFTSTDPTSWDYPEDGEKYKQRWVKIEELADNELAERNKLKDLSPRRKPAVNETPAPKASKKPAAGSIASYRELSDDALKSAYQSEFLKWTGGGSKAGFSKIEKVLDERNLNAEVPVRPWD